MKYRQYELQSGDSRLVCWLESDARLRLGSRLTLQETDERVWTITQRYATEMINPPITKWQVGGLV